MQELASTQLTEKTVKKLINAAVNSGPKLIYAVIFLRKVKFLLFRFYMLQAIRESREV